MDFDLTSGVNITDILGLVIAAVSLALAWWQIRKKKEGGNKQSQDVSGSQNVVQQYSANKITVINYINNGNSDTSEAIQPLLKKPTEEKTSIPLQTDETVSDLKERNQKDEISKENNSFSDYDRTERLALEQISQLLGQISESTAELLKHMRREWQEGHTSKVRQWLEGLRNGKWPFLSSEVKADVLLFEADIELEEKRDIGRARELADEARTLIPSQNQNRIRALIAYHEEGPEEAIKVLGNQDDVDSLNLKAAFLIELGHIAEALEILDFEDESNDET